MEEIVDIDHHENENDKAAVHKAAVELGRRGGRPRGSLRPHGPTVDRPRGPTADIDTVARTLRTWRAFDVPSVRGDVREYIERVWAKKIPRIYEDMLVAARAGEFVSSQALDILKTMTLMTRSLTPQVLRDGVRDPDGASLPSDVDLSHISAADLARITRRTLSEPLDIERRDRLALQAKRMSEKQRAIRAGTATATGAGHRVKPASTARPVLAQSFETATVSVASEPSQDSQSRVIN